MNYIFYLGVLIFMFLSTTVAAQLGIDTVGTFSTGIIVLLFLYKAIGVNVFNLYSHYKQEFNILFIAAAIILIKMALNREFEEIKQALFFIIIPMTLSILLQTQSNTTKKNVLKLVLIFFIAECFLAIYEKIFTVNIFPIILDATDSVSPENWQFRSTAFLGPPLTNALITSTIMAFIIISNIKTFYKLVLIALGFTALLSFNARAATIIWVILIILYLGSLLLKIKKIKISHFVIVITAIIAFSFLNTLIENYGLGGRLLNDDIMDGSALTRVNVFDAFSYINNIDLWFGNSSTSNYLRIMNLLGAGGIENSLVVIIINYGILMSVLLIIAYYFLIKRDISGYSSFYKVILLCSFIVVGSTNNALANHTPWMFFLLCVNTFPLLNQSLDNQNDSSLN